MLDFPWFGGIMGRRAVSGAGIAVCLLMSACSDPAASFKAGLTPAELARFQRGEQVAHICWTCHNLSGDSNSIGPYLKGVFGRPVGTAQGYTYSDVLRNADYTWDRERLRWFLRAPNQVLPGNRMVWPGVTNEQDLNALLLYLEGMTGAE
ncbi:MAG: c-type cytochrome [Deltaproteobacteria bacterium]|nr:c-type cytochrome [Deltaproteobacteria bacterium]